MYSARWGVIGLMLIMAGCASGRVDSSEPLKAELAAAGWTIGTWQGIRRDAADDTDAPMTMQVEAVLGGAGLVEHLEVTHQNGVYRGFAVQVYDPQLGRHVRQYINATRRQFVRLDGVIEADRSMWRSTSPDGTREGRLVSERIGTNGWRRTQSYSDDGGRTWQVLWVDQLQRRGR